MEDMRLLRHILDVIAGVGCIQCWVTGDHQISPHTHTPDSVLNAKVMALRGITRKNNTYWPFCYICWIPFREPCHHPALQRGYSTTGTACPHGEKFPSMIPFLIATIHSRRIDIGGKMKNPFLDDIAARLAVDVKTLTHTRSFKDWLSHEPTNADEIPRCHSFVITFYRAFRMLGGPAGNHVEM
jgi:hypothetical protein